MCLIYNFLRLKAPIQSRRTLRQDYMVLGSNQLEPESLMFREL
jgi:hypothetical protein